MVTDRVKLLNHLLVCKGHKLLRIMPKMETAPTENTELFLCVCGQSFLVSMFRVVLDRASSDLEPVLNEMDDVKHPVFRTTTSTCVHLDQKPLNSGATLPSLTEVLNNIQNMRRFSFRPRPAQAQREGSSRITGCRLNDNRLAFHLSPDDDDNHNSGPGEVSEIQHGWSVLSTDVLVRILFLLQLVQIKSVPQ